ncbi:hypothetical protein T07_8079 [Trichinella nelsoni]|uniref:Uncharacterized protein n=1 Tax=Trichinella nelsoni TaxID=6336 RepID=A0A0V0SJ83_9BILA|nr:hypothetical protein T07_8079 [Trichinella nelsoni]
MFNIIWSLYNNTREHYVCILLNRDVLPKCFDAVFKRMKVLLHIFSLAQSYAYRLLWHVAIPIAFSYFQEQQKCVDLKLSVLYSALRKLLDIWRYLESYEVKFLKKFFFMREVNFVKRGCDVTYFAEIFLLFGVLVSPFLETIGMLMNNQTSKMKKASELVGVMKHYLVEPISSLTYVKGDLGYTSLNTITAEEEEIELRFHSRFLIGVALMISFYFTITKIFDASEISLMNLGIIYALMMPCLLILIIGIILAVITNNSYLILQVALQEAYLIKYSVL